MRDQVSSAVVHVLCQFVSVKSASDPDAGTSRDCRPSIVLPRTAQAFPMRSPSHPQRARSEVLTVVPLLRAALTRWFPVAISAAVAKLRDLL